MDIRFEELQFGKVLGWGTFGMVKEAVYDGREVAAKQIHENYLETEAIKVPPHAHILTLHGYTRDKNETDKYWIVMEKMETDLQKLMQSRKFSIIEALDAMLQIGEGMKHLHQNNILHRDLKPSNVLVNTLSDGKLIFKLADFGTAKVNFDTINPEQHTIHTGTPAFMAPEMFGGSGKGKYNRTIDVYSYGITCSQILKTVPGYSDSPQSLLAQLVSRCREREPEFRPRFDEICGSLQQILEVELKKETESARMVEIELENGSKRDLYKDFTRIRWEIDLNKWNYAITGFVGVGKPALLNALLGFDPKSTEPPRQRTMLPTPYTHPRFNNFVFWDMPSRTETMNHPREIYYYEDNAFRALNAIIIVTGNKILSMDIEIAKRSVEAKVPVVFVRSRANLTIRDLADVNEISMADAANKFRERVKNNFEAEIAKAGLKDIKLFVVTSQAFYPKNKPYLNGSDKSLEGMDEPLLLQFISEKARNQFRYSIT